MGGSASGLRDKGRAPELAPRTKCAKGGVASPGAGMGPAPQKHPASTDGRKSKTYANLGDNTPVSFQAISGRGGLASLSFDRIRPAGDRQSNSTRAAICCRGSRNPSIELIDSGFPGGFAGRSPGGAHSRRHEDALPTQPVRTTGEPRERAGKSRDS